MPYKNRQDSIKRYKRYYKENRKNILEKHKLYIKENKERVSSYRKKNYKDNGYLNKKKYYLENRLKLILGYIPTWRKYFPKKLNCPLCNKSIRFSTGDKTKSFTFDHRHEGKEEIRMSPMQWLHKNPRTKNNQKIWESCDFGILCFQCNKSLPTLNRKKWVKNLVKYTNE
jgi:hypothetical protein